MRTELLGTGLECSIVVKRLLATVCDESRLSLETEAQQMVRSILNLQKQATGRHYWLFMGNVSAIANTAMVTKEQWETVVVYQSDNERRLASRQRYLAWGNMLRASH